MTPPHILVNTTDGVALVTIARPAQRNALSAESLMELAAVLDRLRDDAEVRAIVLTGAGSAFCAGAELTSEWAVREDDALPDRGEVLEHGYNPLILRLRDFPHPVVAAVNGAAAGGGCALALACDIVIAGRSGFFLQPFTAIGLVPDVGSTWLLPRLVGRARATGMMLLGQRVSASQALEWGLIWDMVEDADLLSTATAVAKRLARGPGTALRLTRQALWAGLEQSFEATLRLERENQRIAGRSHDHAEGVSAFLARRSPQFGRD